MGKAATAAVVATTSSATHVAAAATVSAAMTAAATTVGKSGQRRERCERESDNCLVEGATPRKSKGW